jgi:dihydrofolate synthase/folylpolyglutamate synthase
MNYFEAKEYLKKINKYGSVLGLESIRELLKRMDSPEKKLKVVHIAGTNGKGSTMAVLYSVLIKAGYKVGRFSSPAVFDEDETIQINGSNINKEQFADIVSIIKKHCDNMLNDTGMHPTPFEIETAIAFEYFKRNQCDIVLVECGMGGATDATNVFENVLCSIISNISLDHTGFLGDSLESITEIKCGIIKTNCPVVASSQSEEVLNVIKKYAEEHHSRLVIAGKCKAVSDRGDITYTAENGCIYNTSTKLIGTFQMKNIATAMEAAVILDSQGYNVAGFIDEGIRSAVWQGRMEIIQDKPLFIIDGAHNPGAVEELCKTIDLYFTNKRITFIMGVLADKNFEEEALMIADKAANIITVTPDNDRALGGAELMSVVQKYNNEVRYEPDIGQAVNIAMGYVENGISDMVLAFGSLSYLKNIKQAVKAERRD